jgi:hypothetical protein
VTLALRTELTRSVQRSHTSPDLGLPEEPVRAIALELFHHCHRRHWKGYDPYDALNSRVLARLGLLDSHLTRLGFTQLLKRWPFNTRRVLGIPETENAKAIALFLMSSVKLARLGVPDVGPVISELAERLTALRAHGATYWCWGYSFPWQTRTYLVPRGAPNLVCTTFAANALLDRYELDQDARSLEMAISAARYIRNELFWNDGHGAAGFAYPFPGSRVRVHNANFLGAALLCRVARYTGTSTFTDAALRVSRYSASRQRNDGSWPYAEHASSRWVDNFHTGYSLCALRAVAHHSGVADFETHLRRGFAFYRQRFFTSDGAAKYFHDRAYPIDAHSVAQSIITLLAFRDRSPDSDVLAKRVVQWATDHLWDRRGYFYYRVLRFYKNRLSYMRWTQAWMLLALSTMLEAGSMAPTRAEQPVGQR